VPLLTITPAKAQLLPADVKIDLFFIFDGDGRLYTRTFIIIKEVLRDGFHECSPGH
jgi:hypothetical protein